jgi:hypothetical protein
VVWILNLSHLGGEIYMPRPCKYSSVLSNRPLALGTSDATHIAYAKAKEETLQWSFILYLC